MDEQKLKCSKCHHNKRISEFNDNGPKSKRKRTWYCQKCLSEKYFTKKYPIINCQICNKLGKTYGIDFLCKACLKDCGLSYCSAKKHIALIQEFSEKQNICKQCFKEKYGYKKKKMCKLQKQIRRTSRRK